jgi:argonaute-like protein implicated in RNA metabolism and viral defense
MSEPERKTSNCLVKMIRQSSSCDICMKCFSEKKKLVAHRRICEAKNGSSRKLSTMKRTLKKKNENSTRKKQKLNVSADSLAEADTENQLKELSDSNSSSNSINLNFLFD